MIQVTVILVKSDLTCSMAMVNNLFIRSAQPIISQAEYDVVSNRNRISAVNDLINLNVLH